MSSLQALFLRAWTTPGLAESMRAAPREALASAGLPVGDDVAVAVFGWREEPAHLCWDCQLAVPGIYVVRPLARSATRVARSPLDELFVPSPLDATPRERLVALGLEVSANVRVEIRDGEERALELQLCEAHHACLCATPELQRVVFATWPG